MARTTADKLVELVNLLRTVARDLHYAIPSESPGDDDVDRALMAARSIAFRWPDDEAPTAKLPPIRETVLRRPPAPVVAELTGRVELAEALMAELRRELAVLRAVDDDEDLADDEESPGFRLCARPDCGHTRRSHSDDGRHCGYASCGCAGFAS